MYDNMSYLLHLTKNRIQAIVPALEAKDGPLAHSYAPTLRLYREPDRQKAPIYCPGLVFRQMKGIVATKKVRLLEQNSRALEAPGLQRVPSRARRQITVDLMTGVSAPIVRKAQHG
jgi:hypothetical protein